MVSLSRTLVALSSVGWLALTSVGCSCVPTSRSPGQGATADRTPASADLASSNESTASDHASAESASADQQSSQSQDPKSGATNVDPPGKGGTSPEGPAPGKKKPSGVAAIAEALIGKPDETNSPLSPKESHNRATRLEQEALDLEKKGRKGEAFEKALDAWGLVRVHEQDAACRDLAKGLAPILERLGEAANTRSHRATGKPLRIE